MKIKYVGKISPINIYDIPGKKYPDGKQGKGRNISTGEIFDCPAGIAARLMDRFNIEGDPEKDKFIELSEEDIREEYDLKAKPKPKAKPKTENDETKVDL